MFLKPTFWANCTESAACNAECFLPIALRSSSQKLCTPISAYCLTVEKGTMLNTLVERGKIVLPNEMKQEEQFLIPP